MSRLENVSAKDYTYVSTWVPKEEQFGVRCIEIPDCAKLGKTRAEAFEASEAAVLAKLQEAEAGRWTVRAPRTLISAEEGGHAYDVWHRYISEMARVVEGSLKPGYGIGIASEALRVHLMDSKDPERPVAHFEVKPRTILTAKHEMEAKKRAVQAVMAVLKAHPEALRDDVPLDAPVDWEGEEGE